MTDAGGFHETAMIEDVPLWWQLATRLPIIHGAIPSVQYWWHGDSLTHRPGHQKLAPLALLPVLRRLALTNPTIVSAIAQVEQQLASTGIYPDPNPLDHLSLYEAHQLLRQAFLSPP
jgi:hypothetical protein